MGNWDIEFAKRRAAAFEKAKEQQRHLVEQLELRAREAEAKAKLRDAETGKTIDKPGPKGWKRDLAEKALKAKFANGRAPDTLPTPEMIRQARNWLVETHPEKADQISDDTIRRAAGLK